MKVRRTLALLLLAAAAAAVLEAVPEASAPEALPFVAVGDWGRDGSPEQRQVAEAMAAWASAHAARFVVSTGDNFYAYGVRSVADPKWRSSFEDVYLQPALRVPWYVALGNHDYRGNVQAQIDYAAISPRWRLPARFYTVTEPVGAGSSLQLFVLDTTPFLAKYRSFISVTKVGGQDPAAQRSWLEKELAASTAAWKIVVGHHPAHSVGPHGDSPELTRDLVPLLERYGVPVYLGGHDHSLQHLKVG
ncbi:MAG TPA: tartrate-resistant acid phosphatase type 5 family protein, partial [Thermoanaerobaculia bacterium]|nr:tartrate-resistant acid phosphatase type 5 family protein [Thermoanaerobaculia bacterium]